MLVSVVARVGKQLREDRIRSVLDLSVLGGDDEGRRERPPCGERALARGCRESVAAAGTPAWYPHACSPS
eukprot:7354811-Pyramimonas_sp.AAC.1